MRKLLLSSVIIFAISFIAKSQQIPNPGFETWNSQGPFEMPDQWAGSPAVTKSTDAHSGTYTINLKSDIFTNPQTQNTDSIPGICVTGQPGMGPGVKGIDGYPSTARPDSFTGWYKYAPIGQDDFAIAVTLTKWNTSTNQRDIISNTIYVGTAASSYTRFSFPLNYSSGATPDSVAIVLASSDPQQRKLGSILLVDDIAFVTKIASGISSQKDDSPDFLLYPNPAKNILNFTLVHSLSQSNSIRILNSGGKTIYIYSGIQSNIGIDISQFASGIYFIQLIDNRTKQANTKKFVIE